jgi:sugar-specific transcriptional regulator TrmB
MSQLSQWLKQKLVRKLMADRAQLLEAQEEAARKALKVDERLNRIERQIQEQNQVYERRIEELNRQLLAAKEESRELIRNRISQVKMEMERARVRLLAKAQEEDEGVES